MNLKKHFAILVVFTLTLGLAGTAHAACTGDSNDDGTVDVVDLLAILAQWGPCAGACDADTNGDGTVDVVDLLAILAAWGPCPDECAADLPPYYDPSGSDVEWAASGVCAEMNGVAGPPACPEEQYNGVLDDMNYILGAYEFTNAVFDHQTGGGQSFMDSPYLLICSANELIPDDAFDGLNGCYHGSNQWLFGGMMAFIHFDWGVNSERLVDEYTTAIETLPGGICEGDGIVGNYPTGFHANLEGGWNYYNVIVKEACDYDGCRCHAEMGIWSDGFGNYVEDFVQNYSGCIGGTCCTDDRFSF